MSPMDFVAFGLVFSSPMVPSLLPQQHLAAELHNERRCLKAGLPCIKPLAVGGPRMPLLPKAASGPIGVRASFIGASTDSLSEVRSTCPITHLAP
jgi:hypothetical protein